ncbi:hypothetical protein [Hymenobacter sp. YC55]|uniref:hypothetical protein n=1 Tax=Hymenobacter sp. YC55 TaxID=3034019 RepID=UPI0023F74A0C|nr:hypothetical protein [Hymenobacter sp. YC55]MDF7813903.1 hypothetical protein [Hymenobacter sp. YC55]
MHAGPQAGVLLRALLNGESLARKTASFIGIDHVAVLGMVAQQGPIRMAVGKP